VITVKDLNQYHRVVTLITAVDHFSELADERGLGLEGIQVDLEDAQSVARRWAPDIRRDVFSVSKTVTSLAIGMLEHDELLNLDDSVLSHLPALADTAAPGAEAMTVRHLLSMTAGNGYRWLDEDADHPDDPARDFLATPLIAEPGTQYDYRGGNAYVLGRIVHSISGQDLREFLLPRLFGPLEIRNPQWLRCPLGFPLGAIGLQLRTSEIAKIAQLLLHGGLYQGDRLVSSDYISRMISDTTATGRFEPDNGIYGLHVWLCSRDNAWRMDGIYGQFGVVLPESNACVSVTAHYRGPTTDILDAVWEQIVPAL
jgi:CubicO group peptidase (beta-lactamase class C family)